MRKTFWILPTAVLLFAGAALAQNRATSGLRVNPVKLPSGASLLNCDLLSNGFCPDNYKRTNYEGKYIGHDEPALLFYSNVPGAGNAMRYRLRLPTDPATPPNQQGTGGTFNFQLHPAFWFGMDLCDTQSAPEFTNACEPDSDDNIFDDPKPASPHYIGKHPGGAFLELQFYPPGWIDSPVLIDATQYFAAANIFSFNANQNTGAINNADCLSKVGLEPDNFAVITKNGVPLFPANPLGQNFGSSNFDLNNVLVMNPGDTLIITMHDAPGGLLISIQDETTGDSGSMMAGPANGFGQVVFDPNATTCTVNPFAFHPMYSTSSEHTRLTWTLHSYNVTFTDEIGHFEFCDAINPLTLNCMVPGVNDRKLDADDVICINAKLFGIPVPPFAHVGACVSSEIDFDGLSYLTDWPGTDVDDAALHPGPIEFTSPVLTGPNGPQNYQRVAFEADLPGIESAPCNVFTGTGCVNPPPGAQFYPIYTNGTAADGACVWHFGGTGIAGTTNTFGGSSKTEFGSILGLTFPGPFVVFGNFRRVLDENPCPAPRD